MPPQFRIVTAYGGSNYTFENDQFISGKITRVENGFDTATLVMNDYESANWLKTVDAEQTVTVEFKDSNESVWTKVFDGIIRFLNISQDNQLERLELKCDGKGYGLGETVCFSEYGTESTKNPTLNTLRAILNTASTGIIDGFVIHYFGSASHTGYSYTSNNTTCEDIVGEIKYLYLPGVYNIYALRDLFNVVQAIKGTGAGPHWIVDTSGNLLICTLNASHPDAANNGWYKYYHNSATEATLEQGEDFKEVKFPKLSKEANYILYHGSCVQPSGGDYAENNASSWDVSDVSLTLSNDNSASNFKVGAYSIKASTTQNDGLTRNFFYPKTGYLSLDLRKMGGKNTPPIFNFYVKRNTEITYFSFIIWEDFVGTADWAAPYTDGTGNLVSYMPVDKWTYFSFDLIDKWRDNSILCNESAGITWDDIDRLSFYLQFAANDNNKYCWLDGINFMGSILRGAGQLAGYSATNPMKVKVIRDDIAKGDTLVASGDSGTIARLAYAELLRCQTTPIIGTITVPYMKDLLPGQLLHIRAKKKSDGSFNIDKDMRVTQLTHEFGSVPNPYMTSISLTDDLTNSYTRTSFADANAVIKASIQGDKQNLSGRLGTIDITQSILEQWY